MTDINIHLTTFNLGRLPIHTEYFASSLRTSFKDTSGPPDLLVLALQEIAPIGYSFIGGSFVASYLSHVEQAVELAIKWSFGKDESYKNVLTRNAGMTGIMVLARNANIVKRIKWIQEASTGVGWWDMGNKGAIGVRLALEALSEGEEDVLVTFVAAHLAPMEGAWERRNEDWKNICQTLVFEPASTGTIGQKAIEDGNADATERQPLLSSSSDSSTTAQPHGLFNPPSYVFFAGDLNYRTADAAPSASQFENWPQPMSPDTDPNHYSSLFAGDQLTRELKANRTLHHLAEAPISFPPTYKYSDRAQKLAEETAQAHADGAASKDSSTGGSNDNEPFAGIKLDDIQEQVWLWAKHRVPSWCDRILYLTTAPPRTVHHYTALPIQPTSDHRPVVLSCSIPWKALEVSQIVQEPRYQIDTNWKARRDMARRLEFFVGVGAYLGFTGQGEALLAGTIVGVVGGYFVLRYLLIGD